MNYMLNGILSTVGLIKKIQLYKMSYFSEQHTHSKKKVKVGLDLSNYPTKSDLNNTTGSDTSYFAEKADLTSLKSDFDKLEKLASD